MRRPGTGALLGALLLAACYPKGAPPPTALLPRQVELAQAKHAELNPEALERGRVLFVDKCGECHEHPDLTAVRLSKWPRIMVGMIEQSELHQDAAASSDLTLFVTTAAEAAGARP